MSETLMLNIKGRATPYSFQVPKATFDYFKTYHNNITPCSPTIVEAIKEHAEDQTKKLMDSILKWKTKKKEELETYDRHEASVLRVANLFS